MSKLVLILLVLCGTAAFAAEKKALPARAPVAQTQPSPGMTSDQVQGLKNDLDRMKALVQQMETNLAFVDTTQSPLKHQFQLEIDMWKMTIRQMERRMNSHQ